MAAAVKLVACVSSVVGPSGAPGIIKTGIPTIRINNKPIAAMMVSMSTPHGTPPAIHTSFVNMGSASVLANGDPVAFMGCTLMCGDAILFGNPDMVFLTVG